MRSLILKYVYLERVLNAMRFVVVDVCDVLWRKRKKCTLWKRGGRRIIVYRYIEIARQTIIKRSSYHKQSLNLRLNGRSKCHSSKTS